MCNKFLIIRWLLEKSNSPTKNKHKNNKKCKLFCTVSLEIKHGSFFNLLCKTNPKICRLRLREDLFSHKKKIKKNRTVFHSERMTSGVLRQDKTRPKHVNDSRNAELIYITRANSLLAHHDRNRISEFSFATVQLLFHCCFIALKKRVTPRKFAHVLYCSLN